MERTVGYVGIAVVFMCCWSCAAVDFQYEVENPTFFTPGQVGLIINSSIDYYRSATSGYTRFPTGLSLPAQEIVVNGITITLRVFLYNQVGPGTCSANPGLGTITTEAILDACNRIIVHMANQAPRWGSHFVSGVLGGVSLQYFANSRHTSPSLSSQGGNSSTVQIEAPGLLWDANDCWVYGSTLENGGSHHAALYPNTALYSPSRRFMFYLSYICNLWLFDLTDHTRKPMWMSKTRGSNCALVLQLDGNLVLYNGDGSVLWAINKYCTSTSCIISSVFVVQDDGNCVVYRTEDQTSVWATGTQRPA